MEQLILSLGSNSSDRLTKIKQACDLIQKHIGTIELQSDIIQTKPWGFESKNDFLNSAVSLFTNLTARQCLSKIHEIESLLGRTRSGSAGYEDRCIDIDILFYGQQIINEKDLTVPHPLLHVRDFVLTPLKQIVPQFEHPVFKKKIEEL
ncbi:MAG: 2-amino-4-hydroxy-6-hydroxymethyldihydropteridine diphosphokinase [Bacteroidales bacterium]|nr:2-amino-4-hydroxy-6-hydroxymethyldihydropteridine diphosphokinase [Bacteroidales bacterium]